MKMFDCKCVCILESGHHGSSIKSSHHTGEPEEDETTEKLQLETGDVDHLDLVSVTDVESPGQETTEIDSWTRPLALECVSDTEERRACPKNTGSDAPASSASGVSAAKFQFANAGTALPTDKPEISDRSFYVYFSDLPTSHTPDPVDLGLAAYRQLENDHINNAKEMIESVFTDRTSALLRKMGFGQQKCDRLARLVMEGGEVEINADNDEPRSTEDIYEYYRYKTEIESYQCLLISAPGEGELARRRQEMYNFCLQAFPEEHFNRERLGKTVAFREVSNCAHVRTFVNNFFCRSDGIRAKRAIHAIIVFFGHGTDEGFRVGHENMSLNDIISFVKQEWRQALLVCPEQLPVTVEIIFTQCYGHLHSHFQTRRFIVTALTTDDDVLTTSIRSANGTWFNYELKDYAENTLQKKIQHTEEWRQSDRGQCVDLAAAPTTTNKPTSAASSAEDSAMDVENGDDGPSLS